MIPGTYHIAVLVVLDQPSDREQGQVAAVEREARLATARWRRSADALGLGDDYRHEVTDVDWLRSLEDDGEDEATDRGAECPREALGLDGVDRTGPVRSHGPLVSGHDRMAGHPAR